jgi:hypothetical protein
MSRRKRARRGLDMYSTFPPSNGNSTANYREPLDERSGSSWLRVQPDVQLFERLTSKKLEAHHARHLNSQNKYAQTLRSVFYCCTSSRRKAVKLFDPELSDTTDYPSKEASTLRI